MKNLIALACALFAMTAFSDAAKPVRKSFKDLTPAERARIVELRMRQHGGIVELSNKGQIAVLNAQKQIVDDDVTNTIAKLRSVVHGARVDYKTVDGFSIATAKAIREKEGAAACVYLVDDPQLPMSLVAIEEGWGVVNVSVLRDGNPDAGKLKARFDKEFVRVSSIVFSGAKSQYKTSPLQSVTSIADLDKTVGENYGMDTVIAINGHLPEIGVIAAKKITYRDACQRGLAPQPTNEYQKAIWDQIHSIPSAPITIKK